MSAFGKMTKYSAVGSICEAAIGGLVRFGPTGLLGFTLGELNEPIKSASKHSVAEACQVLEAHLLTAFREKRIYSCEYHEMHNWMTEEDQNQFLIEWTEVGSTELSNVSYRCNDLAYIKEHAKEIRAKKSMLSKSGGVKPGSAKKSLKDRSDVM